jgi:acyl carrier protein
MSDIAEQVKAIIAKVAKKEVSEILMDSDLTTSFNLKSMARFELAALLENQFKVSVSNNEIRVLHKVSEVIKLIEEKL